MVKQKEKPLQDSHKDYQWVDTRQGLRQVADYFKTKKAIGVDLEMDSMFHYREKICLIQMATERQTFIIDPLSIPSMSLIKPLFENDRIKKVFHGADYDVRSIFRDFRIEINNLFDTELASRFLGVQQTSLESVLNSRFNVVLDKRYQKKDWSQRPLPEHMIDYAAGDACFLVPLASELEKELRHKKRLSWVKEECQWLRRVRAASNDKGPLFLNFKGAGRLKPADLVVLEARLVLADQGVPPEGHHRRSRARHRILPGNPHRIPGPGRPRDLPAGETFGRDASRGGPLIGSGRREVFPQRAL
jgi:ribonuclease D